MSNNVLSVLSKYAFRQEENYLTEALAFLLRLLLERNLPTGLDLVWFGVRYHDPLVVVFEDNRGYNPVTYRRDLDLEKQHFFSLNKDEQFELLVTFLKRAWEDVTDEAST